MDRTHTTAVGADVDPRTRVVVAVATLALLFQVVHTIEHTAQLSYWFSHPLDAPWLTPWAALGRDALAGLAGGRAPGGAELLHLIGNLIFLGGLVATRVAVRRLGRTAPVAMRRATVLQGLHVAEHVMLTTTWYATGTAAGLTTLLGTATGPSGAALRIWSHLLVNAVATAWTFVALHQLRGPSSRPAAVGR